MNNELRDAIREIVYPSKAEWEWYDDLGAVADERVEAVLQAISDAGYVLVERGEWEAVRAALATANAFLLARASRSERGG